MWKMMEETAAAAAAAMGVLPAQQSSRGVRGAQAIQPLQHTWHQEQQQDHLKEQYSCHQRRQQHRLQHMEDGQVGQQAPELSWAQAARFRTYWQPSPAEGLRPLAPSLPRPPTIEQRLPPHYPCTLLKRPPGSGSHAMQRQRGTPPPSLCPNLVTLLLLVVSPSTRTLRQPAHMLPPCPLGLPPCPLTLCQPPPMRPRWQPMPLPPSPLQLVQGRPRDLASMQCLLVVQQGGDQACLTF